MLLRDGVPDLRYIVGGNSRVMEEEQVSKGMQRAAQWIKLSFAGFARSWRRHLRLDPNADAARR